MFLEMVSHSTGKHKTQLEGTGSGPTPTQVSYLKHISSAMTSPFHLSFLPASFYIGSVWKRGDTRHIEDQHVVCLSACQVPTGKKILVLFSLLCGVQFP